MWANTCLDGVLLGRLPEMSQNNPTLNQSERLHGVRYEIRGPLAKRAYELEAEGADILKLNIGNPGLFGFKTPETMRKAMVKNLAQSEAYCHQQGIFSAREAVVMQQQSRGIKDVTIDEVFMGNGVSELIDMTLRALLNNGDEVLIPSPDYPLWTAAVLLNGGKAVHYPCRFENDFIPKLEDIEKCISKKTKAIVLINPNNPTGAVYPKSLLEGIGKLASKHGVVVFSDEIYDNILYDDAKFVPMATVMEGALCATFGGLSKVYRACGFRVGWVSFSGVNDTHKHYLNGVELLASLRLCSNVPGQWAVQTALGGVQSILELTRPGGRLYESRKIVLEEVENRKHLEVVSPMGAMYAFVRVKGAGATFDDHDFAMKLLEEEHVLVAPGQSFHYPANDSFRITILPERNKLKRLFGAIDRVLA